MTCTTGCLTQDHRSWGECARVKNPRIAYCRSAVNPRNDMSAEKRMHKELDLYASARKEGIQPETTKARDVEQAMRISDQTGEAYGNSG